MIDSPNWKSRIIILAGSAGILCGYDIGIISGALFFIQTSIALSNLQIGLLVSAVLVGALIGNLIAGLVADAYGRKFTLIVASVLFTMGILFIILSHFFITLLLSRWIVGVASGMISVSTPLYVSEFVPKNYRGKYVTFFQLFLTLGIGIAYLVGLGFTPSGNWHAMFIMALFPALVLFLTIKGLPESPYWLITQGDFERARLSLTRTRSDDHIEVALQSIYNSLLKTKNHRYPLLSAKYILPLFICLSIAILNQGTGITVFLQYAPNILKNAGLGSNFMSMLGSLSIASLNFLATLCALFLVDRIGRRKLLLMGICGVFGSELFLGIVNTFTHASTLQGMYSLIGLLFFVISFAIGPGVVVWLAISELLPTRIRSKGMSVCLFFNSLTGSLMSSFFPDLQQFLGINGLYFLCATSSFLYILITAFLLPETQSQSLEEIQHYFENRKKIRGSPIVKED